MEKVDAITLEVMRNAFYSIADEMLAALVRTGFSTNIKDRGDCSSAIYTPNAEEVGQCAKGTPLHIGTLPACVRTVIETYKDKPLEDGDHIIMNTPLPEWTGPPERCGDGYAGLLRGQTCRLARKSGASCRPRGLCAGQYALRGN